MAKKIKLGKLDVKSFVKGIDQNQEDALKGGSNFPDTFSLIRQTVCSKLK